MSDLRIVSSPTAAAGSRPAELSPSRASIQQHDHGLEVEDAKRLVEVQKPPSILSRIGKAIFAVATSNALWNGVRITVAALAIVGAISAGPLGIAGVAIGLAFMGIGMIGDTAHTRSLRKLDQELSLLYEHALQQNEEFKLTGEQRPTRKKLNARSVKDIDLGIEERRWRVSGLQTTASAGSVSQGVLGVVKSAFTYAAKPIWELVGSLGLSLAAGIFNVKYERYDLEKTKMLLRKEIMEQRQQNGAPRYNSMRELKDAVREQTIRTQTLRASEKSGREYDELLNEQTEKYDLEHQKPFGIAIRRFFADFFHSQQPFSDFNNLDWVVDRVRLRKSQLPRRPLVS